MLEGWGGYEVEVAEVNDEIRHQLVARYPFVRLIPRDPVDIEGKTVVLAIKPQSLPSLQTVGRAKAVLSILAGTPLSVIREAIPADAYVRAMPNMGALMRRSMTTLTGDHAFHHEAMELMGSIGRTLWVHSEKEIDVATALAGSGPAYLALVAEALADGAVREGLGRHEAQKLVQGLFDGVAAALEKEHPAILKDKVMSPGGTTAAGYAALEERGVRFAFIEAICAAYKRAKELALG